MRIVAGSARGTRLTRVPPGTRPVSDRAREGLFSSLGERVPGAVCLDLFAGTGAIGIEALSRGGERCDFVDSSQAAAAAIRENLARTHLEDRARVVRSDARRFLAGAEGGYDLAFLDPPYALPEPDLTDVLVTLQPHLLTGATIVLTRPTQSGIDVIPVNLQVVRRLSYGDARILVLEAQ